MTQPAQTTIQPREEGFVFLEVDGNGKTVAVWRNDYWNGRGKYGEFIGDTRLHADGTVGVYIPMPYDEELDTDLCLHKTYATPEEAADALWDLRDELR